MIYALTNDGNRINARNARRNEEYFCPICKSKLILRNGVIKTAHFAHGKNIQCTDDWKYDISDFKMAWQSLFHDDEREILLENDKGIKHIADICTNDYILELQHDKIKVSEFEERNAFFASCGKRVIWLLDLTNEYEEENLVIDEENSTAVWKTPYKYLKKLWQEDTNITVYAQFAEKSVYGKIVPQVIKFQNISVENEGIVSSFGAILNANEFLDSCVNDEEILVKHNKIETVEINDTVKKEVKGHTLTYLWKMNYRVVIFSNINTGMRVKIFDDQAESAWKSSEHKWFGFIQGKNYANFSKKPMEIYNAHKNEWKIEWFVTHQEATY